MKFHESAIAVQTVSMKYKFPFGDLGVLSTYVKSTTGNRAILKMLPSGELWITTWPSKPLTRVLVIWRRKARESVCKLEWLYIAWVSPEHAWIGLAISSILSQVWTISILPNLALSTNWAQWTTFTNLCSFLFLKSVRELVRYYNGSEFHASCLENPQTMEASLDFKISPFLCFLISFCYQYFGLEDFPLEYAAYLTRCYYVPLFY